MSAESAGNATATPQGGGALRGLGEKFAPDLHTGTGNYSVPLVLPPGRNGLQPSVALGYSTGAGQGPFGLGWTISVAQIARKTADRVPRHDADDTFLLSGAEDLVAVGRDGEDRLYRPRTEGLFATIRRRRDGDHWEVATKDGLVSRYGPPAAATSRLVDPRDPRRVHCWRLSDTTDPFGNRIEYEYRLDAVQGRRAFAQSYLKRIRYADYDSSAGGAFLVSVEFCYDDEVWPHPVAPAVRPRPDAPTDHRAGFEIRTRRRCGLIVVRTHAADGITRLVRAWRLLYADEQPAGAVPLAANGGSLLVRIESIGYDDAGTPVVEMPPLDFGYTAFHPHERRFVRVECDGAPLPTAAVSTRALVDLHGAGLPDLVEVDDGIRYWRNLGDGKFAAPRRLAGAPGGVSLDQAGVELADVDGDGRTELVVQRPDSATRYRLDFGPRLHAQPVAADVRPALDPADPEVRAMDLDGDGVADLLRTGRAFECWFRAAGGGWRGSAVVPRGPAADFPDVSFADPRIRIADMNGDGLPDLVQLQSGSIAWWPNLGHGRFGPRVEMARSPRWSPSISPERIQFADVDGDGAADLVVLEDDRVCVWINGSGEGWSEVPIEVRGLPRVTDADPLRVVDLLGSGTAGLLWCPSPERGARPMHFLDLAGGVKPYLMSAIDNNLGAVTRIAYRSSTGFFLDDTHCERTRWRTPLPFPVPCVARTEVEDAFSGGRLVSEYRYRHGYWDGVEREFRGFAVVEQTDTARQRPGGDATTARQRCPPVLTRSWFHVGAVDTGDDRYALPDLAGEAWRGDPARLDVLDGVPELRARCAALPGASGPRAFRDALRALRGRLLRVEQYVLDGSAREPLPLSVEEHAHAIREVDAPPAGEEQRMRVHHAWPRATRTTRWERGDDPQCVYEFQADPDPWGQLRQQTRIGLPRRQARRRPVLAAAVGTVDVDESQVLFTHGLVRYASPLPGARAVRDRVAERWGFELVAPPPGREQRPDDLAQVLLDRRDQALALHAAAVAALAGWSTRDAVPVDLRAVSHDRHHYDGPAFIGRSDGRVEYGALSRLESLAFTDADLDSAYAHGAASRRPVSLDGPAAPPPGAPAPSASELGYRAETRPTVRGAERWYYVDAQRLAYDFQQTGPPPAGRSSWPRRGASIAVQDPRGRETRTELETHWLLPARVTIVAADLVTTTEYDWRTLAPARVVEPNGTAHCMRYAPTGAPAAEWQEGPAGEGGTREKPDTAYEYAWRAYFDTRHGRTPVPAHVHVRRRAWHARDPRGDDALLETREYSDGFGRVLQRRTSAGELRGASDDAPSGLPPEAGTAVRAAVVRRVEDAVVVSGWRRYDDKGRVIEQYEPLHAVGWSYAQAPPDAARARIEFDYAAAGELVATRLPDALEIRVVPGRPIRPADLRIGDVAPDGVPDGFAPTPWERWRYDPNDLAPRSPVPRRRARPPASHDWTPVQTVTDAFGRTIAQVDRNGPDPATDAYLTRTTIDVRGNVLRVIDAFGRVARRQVHDLRNRVLCVESIDAGVRTTVLDATDQPVESRDSRGTVAVRRYDALGRPAQLWVRGSGEVRATLREARVYGDGGERPVTAAERAARTDARRRYRVGRLVELRDEAGVVVHEAYDFRGRVTQHSRRAIADAALAGVAPGERWRVDWAASVPPPLDAPLTTGAVYDALDRVVVSTYPETVDGERRRLVAGYDRGGGLRSLALESAAGAREPLLDLIVYDARGQPELIVRANRTMSRYAYDPRSRRLARLRSERCSGPAGAAVTGGAATLEWTPQGAPFEDQVYTHDYAGNVVSIDERVPGCGIANTALGRDRLVRDYEYDALYRLVRATGRSCRGDGEERRRLDRPGCGYVGAPGTPSLATLPDAVEPFEERFTYDPVGNLRDVAAAAGVGGAAATWRRRFGHGGLAAPSATAAPSNRLTSLEIPGGVLAWQHDANGNVVAQGLDRGYEWDHADRLVAFRVAAGAAVSIEVRYLYAADGARIKTIVRRGPAVESTTYSDRGFELQRSAAIPGGANNRLHVLANDVPVYSLRVGPPHRDDAGPARQYRLGGAPHAASVVLDPAAAWVSREEFSAFGETLVGGFAKKSFRFAGRQRDEHSGLALHGARWYAAWTARWLSTDPADAEPGVSPYRYAADNPIGRVDPSGLADEEANLVCGPYSQTGGHHPVQGAAYTPGPPRKDPAYKSGLAISQTQGDFTPEIHKQADKVQTLVNAAAWSSVDNTQVDGQVGRVRVSTPVGADARSSLQTVAAAVSTPDVSFGSTPVHAPEGFAEPGRLAPTPTPWLEEQKGYRALLPDEKISPQQAADLVTRASDERTAAGSFPVRVPKPWWGYRFPKLAASAKAVGGFLIPDEIAIPYDHLKMLGGGSAMVGLRLAATYARITIITATGEMAASAAAGIGGAAQRVGEFLGSVGGRAPTLILIVNPCMVDPNLCRPPDAGGLAAPHFI